MSILYIKFADSKTIYLLLSLKYIGLMHIKQLCSILLSFVLPVRYYTIFLSYWYVDITV